MKPNQRPTCVRRTSCWSTGPGRAPGFGMQSAQRFGCEAIAFTGATDAADLSLRLPANRRRFPRRAQCAGRFEGPVANRTCTGQRRSTNPSGRRGIQAAARLRSGDGCLGCASVPASTAAASGHSDPTERSPLWPRGAQLRRLHRGPRGQSRAAAAHAGALAMPTGSRTANRTLAFSLRPMARGTGNP